MFAIVDIGGKQYQVAPGKTIIVDSMNGTVGDTISLSSVLLTNEGGKTKVGTPTLKGVVVKAKIIAHQKGEKIHVRRFKSKVRERKHVGFRPQLTKLEILSIEQ